MNRSLLFLALLAGARSVGAQTAENEIIAARDTVWRAFFHNDTAALRRFIPPAAATLEGPNGGRWQARDDIMTGSRNFVKSKAHLVDVRFSDTRITMAGHTALVRSNYMLIIEAGKRVDTTAGRATELFVRQGTTWVNPYWQLEPVDGAARDLEHSNDTFERSNDHTDCR